MQKQRVILMMNSKKFSILNRLKSFKYAINGLIYVLKTQHNAWLHLAISILVICAAFLLKINATDWRWLIIAITLVWFAETINTAFEFVCDVVSPELRQSVQAAKDIAAGAVLLCAIGATMLGLSIFLPYLSTF
jgi:diacylglycerol kinase (ATP)